MNLTFFDLLCTQTYKLEHSSAPYPCHNMPALAMAEQQSSHEHYMYMCNFLGVEPSESYLKKQVRDLV